MNSVEMLTKLQIDRKNALFRLFEIYEININDGVKEISINNPTYGSLSEGEYEYYQIEIQKGQHGNKA